MNRSLGFVNWTVIIVYLLVIVSIGLLTKFKKKISKESYLKGDGKAPMPVMAVSIWATTLSAITFIGFTATVYKMDWRYWIGISTIFILMPFVALWIVPFFKKINSTTAYEYLEKRFSKLLRILSSIIFILFHIGRIAIVVYIPTMAIYAITGFNPYVIAIVVTALTILYTFVGGLKAVIWTDFVQGCVFIIGIILTIFLAVYFTVGSFGSIMSEANEHGKIFASGSMGSTLAKVGIPLLFVGQIFNNVYQYVGSQDVVQRYNSASQKSITKALILNGILAVVGTALLAIIGTLMWSFYKGPHAAENLASKGLTVADIPNGNVSFPTFALDVLPIGVSGLIIASILAAAQSTISSSLSAIVSCVTVDLLPLFKKFKEKVKDELLFAKMVTVLIGCISLLMSVFLIAANQDKIFNYWLGILGLFGTPVSVVFLLGMFTKRTHKWGALFALLVTFSGAFVMWILTQTKVQTIDSLYQPLIMMPIGLISGYVFALLTPKLATDKDVKPLTVWGLKDKYVDETEINVNDSEISNDDTEVVDTESDDIGILEGGNGDSNEIKRA